MSKKHQVACGLFKIAGIFYRQITADELLQLSKGDRLILVREPTNKHDKNAIKCVHDELDLFLGYVPRTLAEHIAPMMDHYVVLYAVVFSVFAPKLEVMAGLVFDEAETFEIAEE